VATYHDFVPGFRALLAQEKNLGKFYNTVKHLAMLDKNARHAQLAQFAQSTPLAAQATPVTASR
jgi:predicted aminopeptidase